MMAAEHQRRERVQSILEAVGARLPTADCDLDQAAFVQAVALYDLCIQYAKATDSESAAAPAQSQRRVRRLDSAPVG